MGGRLRSVFPDEADGLDILMFWRTGKGQVGTAVPFGKTWKDHSLDQISEEREKPSKNRCVCVCVTGEGGCIRDFLGGRLKML